MESTLKEQRGGESVLDLSPRSTVGGGVEDVYGEDRATEDQLVTPWTISVASGYSLLRDTHHNKGLAFTEKEREAHYLRGLLPQAVISQELQEKKLMHSIRQYDVPLHKYMAMMELEEYYDFLHEFMTAVKQNYGEKVLVQFEDFANHNAFELLAKYGTTHLVFNDDIQGTASVVLSGLVASLKLLGGTLGDHTFLFLGAGEAGTGIAELIALEMSKQTKVPLEETRKKIWLVDSKGLIVHSRKESLQHFKKPWAHEHEPCNTLLDAVKAIKPTALIGTSGVGKTFTKEVVEAMAAFNKQPLIMALSNPTSQAECTAEEAYRWTEGRAIFASGSPFDPVEYNGKTYVPGQANNAYIFPGLGFGLVISGAIRVHDDMLLAASEALAGQVTQEHYDKGMIYPPFSNIRKISAHIAANVAAKAYELGVATRLPRPVDLVKYAESCMYTPNYRTYR
ncbi:NADP-dependent malic enzyme-like [Olea europaea var. sylvestris]|uniref:NADP-dependent malic enzyme-like n=1 Tax=Olea europaea var. sylvestris TaxID=158386 RepID=UPI000C1D3F5B|nr:NADP-dependent malic enzyme-like [Olea europaea var. sylvestris]